MTYSSLMHATSRALYTACVTPMRLDGSVDYPSLHRLLAHNNQAGIGVIMMGSTGEGMSLSVQEITEVARWASGLGLHAPLLLGLRSSESLRDLLTLIETLNRLPIQGYLLTTPCYTKPGPKGQAAWLKALLDQSDHPCMVYHIPSRTGRGLHPQTLQMIAHHPRLFSVKDSGGCLATWHIFRTQAPHVRWYCGDDDLWPTWCANGADGLVSVVSNALGGVAQNYVRASLAHHNNMADTHAAWHHFTCALRDGTNPIPIKGLLHDLGLIQNDYVRLPLSLEDWPQDKRSRFLNLYREAERVLSVLPTISTPTPS